MEHKPLKGDCREEHEEGSEDKNTILTNSGCANKRASTNGSLKYEGVPNDGCSQLYVGDIEIRYENFAAIQIYHEHKDEYLVSAKEEPRSTSPSPLELQRVDQIQNEEEEEVHSHEPSFIEGSLKISERDIQESLRDRKSVV